MTTIPDDIDQMLRDGGLDPQVALDVACRTLDEDLAWGPDVTTDAIFTSASTARACVVSREDGVLAGLPIAALCVHVLAQRRDEEATTSFVSRDGDRVTPGSECLVITADTRTLLTAERSLLNISSQLSGVASATARWVDALAGTRARIRDTRKTVPGLRVMQKYAVRCGGGVNHRMGVGDAALIKDNHIAAAGSITAAIRAIAEHAPNVACEVECDTFEQVKEAVEAGAKLVLLDNMDPELMTRCVELTRPAGVATEASGGLTLEDAAATAATGVDFISVGALTHSSTVLDLGLDMA